MDEKAKPPCQSSKPLRQTPINNRFPRKPKGTCMISKQFHHSREISVCHNYSISLPVQSSSIDVHETSDSEMSLVTELTVCQQGAQYVADAQEENVLNGLLPEQSSFTQPTDTDLLLQVHESLLMLLPDNWISVPSKTRIQIGFFPELEVFTVRRFLLVFPDGKGAHGKKLPPSLQCFECIENIKLCRETVDQFIQNITRMVASLRLREVCRGVEEFQHLWSSTKNSYIDYNSYCEARYIKTCRSEDCSLLVDGVQIKRCNNCSKLRQSMSKRSVVLAKELDRTPPKRKEDKYFTAPEITKRLENQRKELRSLRLANERLGRKVDSLPGKKSVDIDQNLNENLVEDLSSEEIR